MLSPQSARLAPSLRSSSSWCWLGNGAALAALFMVTAVANLYLFHYSRGLYATEPQPFPAGDSAVSAAELTRAWTMRAAEDALARHVSDAAAAPVGAVLSVQGLGFQPFDPNQKINAWDVYPPDVSCPDMVRVGNVGDGGKFVCGLSWLEQQSARGRRCVVYSYGISTDTSFENDLAARAGCVVHGFDPTVGQMRVDLGRHGLDQARFTFHKSALSTISGSSSAFALAEHLHDTMARLGHSFVDVLKVDVEGSEWLVIEDLLRDPAAVHFGQLLIELHFQSAALLDGFMRSMRSAGFVSFSREINLIPTLKGSPPLAVEYSFIRPGLFFSPEAQPKAPPAARDLQWLAPINGVIYILTHSLRVAMISETLQLLYMNVWQQAPHYPVVIFHDDLLDSHKLAIQSSVPRMPLQFIRVAFQLPPQLNAAKIPPRTLCSALSSTIGYRHMIRFHATQVHGYLEQLKWPNGGKLEYIWRLDDDSYITHPIGYDIFKFMLINRLSYGFVNMVKDDPLCIRGLWDHAKEFHRHLNASGGDRVHNESFFHELDEGAVFYNNFEVSAAALWRDSRWAAYMDRVDATGNIYMERWGDAPLHTIGVAMLVGKHRVHKFTDIGYRHDPFVLQAPAGLPRPGLDPLRSDDSICVFYEKWICTSSHLLNGTNSTRVYLDVGVPLPAWAVVSSAAGATRSAAGHGVLTSETRGIPPATDLLGVLWTFMDGGKERILAGTLNSFYINYAKDHLCPIVVFYEGVDASSSRNTRLNSHRWPHLQLARLRALLSPGLMEILQLVPVDLSGLNQSIECSGGEMSPLRSWLCNDSALTRSSGFVPPPPSPACLGQNGSNFKYPSLQNNYMMAVSAFLSFRAQNILSNMGYAWMWRFSLSSKLLRPVTYNVFERLASEGKRYAFLSAVQERSECVSGAWKVARRLCEARPDCLGLLARWPPGMVVLTHFEVSHRSVWESAIFLELLNELQTLQRNYSSAFHATEQSIDAKTLWWWKDPLVHTLGVLLSLTVQDTLKLTNFPYQLVDVDKMIGAPQAHFLSGRHGHAYQFKSISGLDEKFRPQRFGWLGADVAASFALPRPEAWREFLCSRLSRPSTAAKCAAGKARGHELDQFIWLFGDTIIGTSSEFRRLEGVVVPNSVGMASIDASKQRPEERLVQVKYFWGSGAYGIPAEIFSVSGLDLVGDSSVHGAMNITEIGDHKANAMKYWPLSGVSILDLSGLPDAGLGLSGDDMLARACRVLVLGHVVVPNLKLASKFSSDAESLFGTEILDFSIVRSAFGIVSNPYSPPSMWSYIWRVIPPVRHGNIVSYEWFGLAHSSSSPGVTSAESLYMLGVVEYNTGGSTSAGYSQNQGSAAVRYNVIGRVSALNALGGQLDIEVIEDNAGGERSWKRLYGDDTVTAANCFPFHGVATEGTLDYDEDMLEWVFVGLIIFENAFQICRLSAATNAISGPPPIETCDWRCQVIPAVDKAWIGRSNIVSYAGRMHRELMQPKAKADRSRELVISYVPNVAGEPQELFSEINNQAYTPKFVSVRIDYDSKKSPAGLVNNFLKGWQ